MESKVLKYDLLLLLTAAIWGFAFVAQRVGMDYLGPFMYNGLRFGLGAITLLPVMWLRSGSKINNAARQESDGGINLIKGGLIIGVILFCGAAFQQVGLIYTTAGKAGFITGLYVVFVPIAGLFFRQHANKGTWIGAVLALAGLYLLSVTENLSVAKGDVLVIVGAFFWTGHVMVIGNYSPKVDPVKLAFYQFVVCAFLSFFVSFAFETTTFQNILDALIPVLYAGFLSAGVAFTLQVVAQQKSPPAHASIIMSLEGLFAVLGGWLILHEVLSDRGIFGCGLMLLGMVLSQTGRLKAMAVNSSSVDNI